MQDPIYPKILFPSRKDCAQCYVSLKDNDTQSEYNEKTWVEAEILSFLNSFYSKHRIVGIEESQVENRNILPKAKEMSQKNVTKDKIYDYEDDRKLVIESPQKNENALKHQSKKLNGIELDAIESNFADTTQKTTDMKIFLILIFIILSVFGGLKVYFRYNGKKKLKKHII